MNDKAAQTEKQAATPDRNRRQVLQGLVVSTNMDKTIVVRVERSSRHRYYHKVIRLRRKFYAHDAENDARPGDKVAITACRPLSKLKHWRLTEVLNRAPQD